MLNIYVSTSNSHSPALRIYSYLFNKHWGEDQEVTVFGFEKPKFSLPKNFTFVSLGEQRGINFWGEDQEEILKNIKEDYFIYMFENEFFLRPVNKVILADFEANYLTSNLGRVDLTPGPSLRSHDIVKTCKDYDVINLTQTASYRVSLRAGIWNKEYFKKFIGKNITPVHFELVGSEKAMNDGREIVASKRDFCLYIMDGIRGGDINNLDLRAKNPEVSSFGMPVDEVSILEMKELGIIEETFFGYFKVITT